MYAMSLSSIRSSARPWVLMPLLGLLWGSSYLWIALLAGSFPPITILLLRSVAALAIIGSITFFRRKRFPPFGRVWFHLFVITVAADMVPLFMLIWAQSYVASSVTAVLNSTIPLFTLLISALIFRSEIITGERLAGIALGIVGVATLSGASTTGAALLSPGVLAVTVSSIFYGFGFVYARRYVRGDAFAIVTIQMAMTIAALLPLGFAIGELNVENLGGQQLAAVIGLGALSSGLAYAIYYQALYRLGPTMTSYATYVSPVVALCIGWLVLDERIGALSALGILTIAAGVLTASGVARSLVPRIVGHHPAPALAEEAPADVGSV